MSRINHAFDSPDGYGLISRSLHWLMVVLFSWQFITAILRVFAKDTAIYDLVWSTHSQLGFALFLLVLVRGLWGLLNLSMRPHRSGVLGGLAGLGHLVIYALMFAVPALALLRSYGNGRVFSFLGLQVFESTGIQDAALTAPANAVHGLLGWLLLAAIIGHVLMVFVHHFAMRDNTLGLMTGRRLVRHVE